MKFLSSSISRLTGSFTGTSRRWLALFAILIPATFFAGFALGDRDPEISFHDMIINHPSSMSALIDPDDSRVKALAKKLASAENIYNYVRDNIAFDPSLPSVSAGEILAHGRGSCLGKAALLCSLYRASGLDDAVVRVVTGEVDAMGGPIDHAWVELEYNGACLQQDTTDMLGRFGFDQFKGMAYTTAFIRREGYVFNDRNFAIVSRLNMMKGSGHPLLIKGSIHQ
jgi:transglutaminase-like putative cysteine protease